jgi:hypothetical protein
MPLVRERALAAAVQGGLERLYQLDRVVDVHDYLHQAGEGERETLFLHEPGDGTLEMALRVPALDGGLDPLCQIIEGVSHFVYLADRASAEREATQLELELQAEVDKYVVLAASIQTLDVAKSARLREQLYDRVVFAHEGGTERGERYRVANALAGRFARALERRFVATTQFTAMRRELRAFYRMGQEDKLRLARAA